MEIKEVNLNVFIEHLEQVWKMTTTPEKEHTVLLLEYIHPGKKLKLRIGDGDDRALVSVYYKDDLYNFQPERPVRLSTMQQMLKSINNDLQAPEKEIKAAWIKHKGKVSYYAEEEIGI